MKHYRERDGIVHGENACGDDRTLCGVILEGIEGQGEMAETAAVIDCGDCIGIIEHCKKFRSGEYMVARRNRK